MIVYLDNSATTRAYDKVALEMSEMLTSTYGNPSALHPMGIAAEKKVRESRKQVAKMMSANEKEIIFTSCGTESDNMAIYGIAKSRKHQGKKIITTKVEHPAVLEVCKDLQNRGFEVAYIDVDDKCNIDMQQLNSELDENTILVSVMTVNNETGTIMPIREISELCQEKAKVMGREWGKDLVLHTDAVQALGKIPLTNLGAHMISVSAHKIHGPKGVGALYLKEGVKLPPYIIGGGQEMGRRSGTENSAGIVGFGTACKLADENFDGRVTSMKKVRSYLLEGIKENIGDIIVNSPEDGCPSVLNVSFLGTRGEVLLHTLEQDGIMVSTGSACSSGKKGFSHVLTSMGLSDKEIEGAIRFSFSEFNTIEEMDYVLDKLQTAVTRFRRLGSFR